MVIYTVRIDNETSHALDLLAKVYRVNKDELTQDILKTYVADNYDTVMEMEGEI